MKYSIKLSKYQIVAQMQVSSHHDCLTASNEQNSLDKNFYNPLNGGFDTLRQINRPTKRTFTMDFVSVRAGSKGN